MSIQLREQETAAMTQAGGAAAQLLEHYRAAAPKLPGAANAWVKEWRDKGAAVIAEQGLPHRRVEEWKYTDLRANLTEAYPPVSGHALVATEALDAALGSFARLAGPRAVFVNGEFAPALARLETLPKGVSVQTLRHLLNHPADWFKKTVSEAYAPSGEIVAALNAAFATDGAVIRLPKGVKLTEPIHLIYVSSSDAPVYTAWHNLIIAEEGAEAIIVESYVTLGQGKAQTCAVTQIEAAANAKITHVKAAAESAVTQHLGNLHVRLGQKADFLAVPFNTGAGLARHQMFLRYEGAGARAHYAGAQLLRGRQHCDMTLIIDHAAEGCESREHVKAVVMDHAQGVFQGKVIVRPGAQKTDGKQMAQALLLSDNAEFDSKPELEIYADDVKCNHGSTAGALDEDMLFYLRARGISEAEARALLIQAFISEIFDKIGHEGVREVLRQRAEHWLRQAD